MGMARTLRSSTHLPVRIWCGTRGLYIVHSAMYRGAHPGFARTGLSLAALPEPFGLGPAGFQSLALWAAQPPSIPRLRRFGLRPHRYQCWPAANIRRSPRGVLIQASPLDAELLVSSVACSCDCISATPRCKSSLRHVLTRSLRFAPGCGFRACSCSVGWPKSFSHTATELTKRRTAKRCGMRFMKTDSPTGSESTKSGQLLTPGLTANTHAAERREGANDG